MGLRCIQNKIGFSNRQVPIHTDLSGPHSTKKALRCPDWLPTGLVISREALRGPKLPQLVSQGVSGPVGASQGHSRAVRTTSDQYEYVPVFSGTPLFVLKISQLPKVAQNWFCIQNLHMDFSFQ